MICLVCDMTRLLSVIWLDPLYENDQTHYENGQTFSMIWLGMIWPPLWYDQTALYDMTTPSYDMTWAASMIWLDPPSMDMTKFPPRDLALPQSSPRFFIREKPSPIDLLQRRRAIDETSLYCGVSLSFSLFLLLTLLPLGCQPPTIFDLVAPSSYWVDSQSLPSIYSPIYLFHRRSLSPLLPSSNMADLDDAQDPF